LAQARGNPSARLDQALRDTSTLPSRPKVIVKYREGRKEQVRKRLTAQNGRNFRQHDSIGALSLELPAKALAAMAADPDVLGLSIDAPVAVQSNKKTTRTEANPKGKGHNKTPTTTTTDGYTLPAWFDSQALRSTLGVQMGEWGADVGIAIIDSGISPSPDLEGRIAAFYDFTQGGVAAPPSDEYGHGTHIAGLIAGTGKLSDYNYVGVALGARLIGLKVLDSEGQGYTSDVLAAIDFAVANRERLRIDVINLSLGHPIFEPAATDPLVQAVERAAAAGIVVVVSAGNNGYNPVTGEIGYAGVTSPGNAPSALTVGSMRTKKTADRTDDEVSKFSSRGPTWYDGLIKPDVLAPGQGLVSIANSRSKLYSDPLLRDVVTPYIKLSGTSMATGVTSGVVALVIEAHRKAHPTAPALTPNLLKAILQYTAIPVADDDTTTPAALEQGAGGVNAAGAQALARAIDTSMPVGTSWLEYGVLPMSVLGGVNAQWAEHIVWGDRVVGGDTITWSLNAWSEHIVWGDSDEHIVWGDRVVQGIDVVADSFSAWSEHIVWGDAVRVVWSDLDEHIVWGDMSLEHIVWGDSDEHIVWGDSGRFVSTLSTVVSR
jgi:serine protease AprX